VSNETRDTHSQRSERSSRVGQPEQPPDAETPAAAKDAKAHGQKDLERDLRTAQKLLERLEHLRRSLLGAAATLNHSPEERSQHAMPQRTIYELTARGYCLGDRPFLKRGYFLFERFGQAEADISRFRAECLDAEKYAFRTAEPDSLEIAIVERTLVTAAERPARPVAWVRVVNSAYELRPRGGIS